MWLLVVTLMKIYNEKEQAEQGKLQNVNFEEKKSTKKWNRDKFWVQGDTWMKKWNKGSGVLREKSHTAEFPSCGQELKKVSELVMVGHTLGRQRLEDL